MLNSLRYARMLSEFEGIQASVNQINFLLLSQGLNLAKVQRDLLTVLFLFSTWTVSSCPGVIYKGESLSYFSS